MEINYIQMNTMNNKKSKTKLYCCYSLNLRKYLYDNGVEYELAAKNPNSDGLFWVYVKTEELDRLLSEWSANKRTIPNR